MQKSDTVYFDFYHVRALLTRTKMASGILLGSGLTTEYINSLTSSMCLFLMKMHPIKHEYIYTNHGYYCDTQESLSILHNVLNVL